MPQETGAAIDKDFLAMMLMKKRRSEGSAVTLNIRRQKHVEQIIT